MKHQRIGNSIVAQCTYFLASAGDFFDAHNDKSMIDATELRGITFIKEDGSEEWKRYLFLDKFFNINQCNGSNVTYMNLKINDFDIITPYYTKFETLHGDGLENIEIIENSSEGRSGNDFKECITIKGIKADIRIDNTQKYDIIEFEGRPMPQGKQQENWVIDNNI
jgi:hypothetical protein